MTPTRQLKAIRTRVGRMIEDQYRLFHEEILPWMEVNGINPWLWKTSALPRG